MKEIAVDNATHPLRGREGWGVAGPQYDVPLSVDDEHADHPGADFTGLHRSVNGPVPSQPIWY